MSTFQLSVLSQNDPGAQDGADLYCIVTRDGGGEPAMPSFPLGEKVPLPIPPVSSKTAPPTPTWFIPFNPESEIVGNDKVTYTITIGSYSKTDKYPEFTFSVCSDELPAWVKENGIEDTNQIYRGGVDGIFGYAQENKYASEGKPYWIYTVTAGVLDPKVHPGGQFS